MMMKIYAFHERACITSEDCTSRIVSVNNAKRPKFHPATYIGKGKLEELTMLTEELEPDVIVFNNELTPSQIRNLSSVLDARVIDRTQLILDILRNVRSRGKVSFK